MRIFWFWLGLEKIVEILQELNNLLMLYRFLFCQNLVIFVFVGFEWDIRNSWLSKHKNWDNVFLTLRTENKTNCQSKYNSQAQLQSPFYGHDTWKWRCVLWNINWHSCQQTATVGLVLSVCMNQSDRQFYSLKEFRITGTLTEQTCCNCTSCWVFPVLLDCGFYIGLLLRAVSRMRKSIEIFPHLKRWKNV